MDKIVCSGAIFYSKSTKRILLLQKAEGKHSGTWGLVGGTTEPGESVWECLVREIKEELGITPTVLKTIPIETFVSDDEVFNFNTFVCIVQDEFMPILSDEHNGWTWCKLVSPPRPLHQALSVSFSNKIIQTKLQTIFDVIGLTQNLTL